MPAVRRAPPGIGSRPGEGAGGIQHHAGSHIEALPAEPVGHRHSHDPAVAMQEPLDLAVVGHDGAGVAGRADKLPDQARRVVQLPIPEEAGTGEVGVGQLRKPSLHRGTRDEPRRRDPALQVRNPPVPVGGQAVEKRERHAQCLGAAQAMTGSRHQHGERVHQMGGDPQQRRALPARLADPCQVEVLQVADAAVHHLERVGRGRAPEVAPLEQRHREAALGRIPGRGGTADSAAHDREVELAAHEVLEITSHLRVKICAGGEGALKTGGRSAYRCP